MWLLLDNFAINTNLLLLFSLHRGHICSNYQHTSPVPKPTPQNNLTVSNLYLGCQSSRGPFFWVNVLALAACSDFFWVAFLMLDFHVYADHLEEEIDWIFYWDQHPEVICPSIPSPLNSFADLSSFFFGGMGCRTWSKGMKTMPFFCWLLESCSNSCAAAFLRTLYLTSA